MARMLIVDDQDMMRDSLAAILAREGHEVIAASDGQSALARLSSARIDLVISDMKMPKMGGLELLAEVKKTKADMPVLLMTAYGTVQNAVDAMKLGGLHFLCNPFDLAAGIMRLVGMSATQPIGS